MKAIESYLNHLSEITFGQGALIGGVATYAISNIVINAFIPKEEQKLIEKCARLSEAEPHRRCFIQGYTQLRNRLRSLKSKCSKDKNPEKCEQQLDKKIEKYDRRIQVYQEQIRNMKKE